MPAALPIGLPVILALSAPIDTDTAAAGDLVSAEVVKNVTRPESSGPGSGDVLIQAGATVRGRITRVEHHLLPKAYFLIAMSFNRVEVAGVPAPFAARLDPSPELMQDLGVDLAPQSAGWNNGTLLVATKKGRYLFPAGFQSKWSTLATPGLATPGR